jgi:hypothetical protein
MRPGAWDVLMPARACLLQGAPPRLRARRAWPNRLVSPAAVAGAAAPPWHRSQLRACSTAAATRQPGALLPLAHAARRLLRTLTRL